MGRFHIKNILLGIGMGLVLTALTGIIYSAGREPQMSKEEIMAKARQYGMVPSNEIIEESENELVDEEEVEVEPAGKQVDNENIQVHASDGLENNEEMKSQPTQNPEVTKDAPVQPTANPDNDENVQIQPASTPENVEKRQVKIKIAPGDNSYVISKKLVEEGLIDNANSFINEIRAMKLQTSIQVGEYTIEEGTDIKTIIRIICKRKKI